MTPHESLHDSTINEKGENTGFYEQSFDAKNDTSTEELKKTADKGYDKNIVGYVAKKAINLMFSKFSKKISKKCKELKVNYREFKKTYKSAEERITGPMELNKLFRSEAENEEQAKMKKLFHNLFNKLLRKHYMVYSLKVGKMRQFEPYIRKKNTHLLYFADSAKML